MGEWHSFCSVSGQHCSEENDVSEYWDAREQVHKVMQPLAMSDDERAGMCDLVLYGPFGAANKPLLEPFATKPVDIAAVDITDVQTIYDVVTEDHNLGGYATRDGLRDFVVDGETLILEQLSVYRILLAATGGCVNGRILWATRYTLGTAYPGTGVAKGIDYGVISRSWEQFVQPHLVADSDGDPLWYSKLFARNDMTTEEKVCEATMGRGNLWVFKRPDRFPVREVLRRGTTTFVLTPLGPPSMKRAVPLGSLPPEILFLIVAGLRVRDLLALLSTCKTLRTTLMPDTDMLCRDIIKASYPHLLPYAVAGPYGDAEMVWWDEQVALARGSDTSFPWLAYARACKVSPSMRNRERIWGIAKQFEAAARELDLIPE